MVNYCEPQTCDEGQCEFGLNNLRINASLILGPLTGKTICGEVLTIDSGGEVPYPGNDWSVSFNATGYGITAEFVDNTLRYGANTSYTKDKNIDVVATVTNVRYGKSMQSNLVTVSVPYGTCAGEPSLVLETSATAITYSKQTVILTWYYTNGDTILNMDRDGIDARNCVMGDIPPYVSIGQITTSPDGKTTAVVTFEVNPNQQERYAWFSLTSHDFEEPETKTVTIVQKGVGLDICISPLEATIPFSGGSVAFEYFLSEDGCATKSSALNYWTGLTLNCPDSISPCPSTTTLDLYYRKIFTFGINDSDREVTHILTATCTNIRSKTATIKQEASPSVYGIISPSSQIGYEGGEVVISYYISDTQSGSQILPDDYYVNSIWQINNGEINKCKISSSLYEGECSFNDSSCLSIMGVVFNGASVDGSKVNYRFKLPTNVDQNTAIYTFKIGDNKSVNGKTGLTTTVAVGGVECKIALTTNKSTIDFNGGTVTLRWYVYTGSTESESNAIDNETIKAGFNYNQNTVSINNGNPIYWSQLASGDYGIRPTGELKYSFGVFEQTFEISNNMSPYSKDFKFTVSNYFAQNGTATKTVTQDFVCYYLHVYKDYNDAVTYDGKRLDGNGTTVKIYYYLSESDADGATPITDESILFDNNHNSYLNLSTPQGVNVVNTGYSNGLFYKEVSFDRNDTDSGITHEFTATCAHYNCREKSVSIYQGSPYDNIIPNCDYFVFTYSWKDTDGRDLDSLTVLSVYDRDGNMTSFKDEYYNNSETSGLTVGWQGSAKGVSVTSTTLTHPITSVFLTADTRVVGDVNNPYLKHGADNTQSGAEGAIVNIKSILNSGRVADDDTIKIDIYGNWYGDKSDGNCIISYSQFTGSTDGNYQTEILESEHPNNPTVSWDERFYYSFSNTSAAQQIGSAITTNEIYVLAAGSSNIRRTKATGGCPIEAFYSKLATLTFNNRTNTTTLDYGKWPNSGYNERDCKIVTTFKFMGVQYNESNPRPSTFDLPATGGTFTVENIQYKVKYGSLDYPRHLYYMDNDYIQVDYLNSYIYASEIGDTKAVAENDRGIKSIRVIDNGNDTYNIEFEMDSYQNVMENHGRCSSLDFFIHTKNPCITICDFYENLPSLFQFKLSSQ